MSMDFIMALLPSNGKTTIWVIVDRFSKFSHFIALPTHFTAASLAIIFLYEICRLHGVPKTIVSDCDSVLWANFGTSYLINWEPSSSIQVPITPKQTDKSRWLTVAYYHIYDALQGRNHIVGWSTYILPSFGITLHSTRQLGWHRWSPIWSTSPNNSRLPHKRFKNPFHWFIIDRVSPILGAFKRQCRWWDGATYAHAHVLHLLP